MDQVVHIPLDIDRLFRSGPCYLTQKSELGDSILTTPCPADQSWRDMKKQSNLLKTMFH